MKEKLILNTNDSLDINISKIIQYVRKLEKSKGLTDEEVSYKYTHGSCDLLASLLKEIFPSVRVVIFGNDMSCAHYCVSVKGDPSKDENLGDYSEARYYYDINGRKYYDEMVEYLSKEFSTNPALISVTYAPTGSLPDITPQVLSAINFENEEKKEYNNKKLLSLKDFSQLICGDIETVKIELIKLGYDVSVLNEKSEIDLRTLLTDYFMVDYKELVVDIYSPLETVQNLQKEIYIINIFNSLKINDWKDWEILVDKISYTDEKEIEKDSIDEKKQYLFHTEKLYEEIVAEFLTSTLSAAERVTHFIERVKHLKQAYTNCAAQTPEFIGSDRYKEVYEFMQTIPKIDLYKPEETHGKLTNSIKAQEYYSDIAKQLETMFSNSDEPKTL